ncbi:hypothetical protein ATK36_2011 [Amycolatopsis sulphurea]|uniref:Uncharacterized protein n=1 Tax=Amycolatopsis sulphurea TaxID=76022 RepID=A0A2A9F8X9_9PSEU|nr:hypothetical protein ATK36_2011 [Amycolatopsis sulphurea]
MPWVRYDAALDWLDAGRRYRTALPDTLVARSFCPGCLPPTRAKDMTQRHWWWNRT